jgi:RNA polymerase sigma factor (sigma-70 family)
VKQFSMSLSLGEIWNRVKDGDKSAWSEIVARYANLVFTVARRVGLTTYDAEDCAQHTWLALYRHRNAIRDPRRLPAWLILTTRREAIRMIQRQRRAGSLALESTEETAVALPDEELMRLEQLDALEHALSKLDPRCRTLLRALFFSEESLSYNDIAVSLGLAPNSMGPIRSRCLKRLKRILEEADGCTKHDSDSS